jgi:hypothetical protein
MLDPDENRLEPAERQNGSNELAIDTAAKPTTTADELAGDLRERLLAHLRELGVNGEKRRFSGNGEGKATIRALHKPQRDAYRERERAFVAKYGYDLVQRHFADGSELDPRAVCPALTLVEGEGEHANLFRLSTLLWSVPVSRGYGRRMRFLVRDDTTDKLIGVFALCDPVFNLKARDNWIGWNVEERRQRLVNVMDAYVVGAVPPYSQLIGGKVVAALMTSMDVCQAFADKYKDRPGIISEEKKNPKLALLTVTSALGRSSLYNRLRIRGLFDFQFIGKTEGWGHFQVPDDIFYDMRRLLQLEDHTYASGHQFGQGPNWRMRVVRVALQRMGLDQDLLRHGIAREVYAAPLASNWRECLCGQSTTYQIKRPSADEIGRRAVERWLRPRANRFPDYQHWTRAATWKLLGVGGHEVPLPHNTAYR